MADQDCPPGMTLAQPEPPSPGGEMAHVAHVKKERFLRFYADTGNIRDAARAAGIGRRTHYNWLKADEGYRRAFRDARKDALDALESEARRRAVEGIEERHYDKDGKLLCSLRKYSDALLIFLLKGANPKKYKPGAVRIKNDNRDQRGQIGQQINISSRVMTLDPSKAAEIAARRAELRAAFAVPDPPRQLEGGGGDGGSEAMSLAKQPDPR